MTWGEGSALAPAGPQAARLAHVYWTFFGVCVVVYLVVLMLFVAALARRSDGKQPNEARRLSYVVAGGVVTGVVLLGLLAVTAREGHGLNPLLSSRDALVVQVVARQWWWEFRYPGSAPDQLVTTANEMHIPVGRPVLLQLASRDVIHSFWVPSLHGKRDLIPGHDSTTYIQADRAGLFRGQCAEFCGAQHAKMGFVVVAEASDQFERWLAEQRRPAAPPSLPVSGLGADGVPTVATDGVQRGQTLFLRGTCPMCHTVAGTVAGATMGPDLTHVASRLTLGAGSLGNDRTRLAQWVANPHAAKPGNRMPPSALDQNQVADVVTYLETLR